MVISCINQKGGVGKTTTVANLGAYLAQTGAKVLLIDIDPQANLTGGLQDINPHVKKIVEQENQQGTTDALTTYDVIVEQKVISSAFISTTIENLFLVPSSIALASAEIELVSALSRESILQKALSKIDDQFDYIIIDCPPSLGLLTLNALVAANKVIIPVQCEYYALEGLTQLMNTVKLVKNNINFELAVGGVILTMYDARTKLSKEVADEVKSHFKDLVFDSIVPRNVRLTEAPSHGKPVNLYDPSSTGAVAYQKLAAELVKRFPPNRTT